MHSGTVRRIQYHNISECAVCMINSAHERFLIPMMANRAMFLHYFFLLGGVGAGARVHGGGGG